MNKAFVDTPLSSPICKWSLPLIARKGREWLASGTAIIIGQRLAITAKHVIEDFMARLGTVEVSPKQFKHEFSLHACQMLNNGTSAVLWDVNKIWRSGLTDIAFLLLHLTTAESLRFPWKKLHMDLRPLAEGEKVHAFGYPMPMVSLDKTGDTTILKWKQSPSTTSGVITRVYGEKRDNSFLKFPCYETNALFLPSMSGGPVFSKRGLCGLICSGMDLGETDAAPIGYIVALWPAMATHIDIDRIGHPKGVTYPVIELAKDDLIKADGWENIRTGTDERNEVWITNVTSTRLPGSRPDFPAEYA